jgi:hypothetical protein
MRRTRFFDGLLAALLVLAGCAEMSESKKAHELASTQGQFKVRLTNEVESVAGRCKFVRNLVPDDEPGHRPSDAELPDYFRTEAVYNGADTVVVRGRVGEAYICGPGPLNPDGTLKRTDAGPH